MGLEREVLDLQFEIGPSWAPVVAPFDVAAAYIELYK